MTIIYPSDDATITDYAPDTNYGSETYLECNHYATYAAGFFIKFSLTRKPIKTATINLYCYQDLSPYDIRHRGIITQFDESTVTWNNQPTISSEFQSDISPSIDTWNSIAYKNILNRTVSHEWGGSVFSQPTYQAENQAVSFYSKEYDAGSHKGYADITYFATDEVASDIGPVLLATETWNWWGDLHVDAIDCISSPSKVQCDITTPWQTTFSDEILTNSVSYTWQNGATDEYFMIVPNILCGATDYVQFTQYWWFGTPQFYVKTGGDDTEEGVSWANAWKHVNTGMVRAPNDSTLRIGFDVGAVYYSDEPANNTLSPDADNVTVIYETETTGGGTGTATVEVNS